MVQTNMNQLTSDHDSRRAAERIRLRVAGLAPGTRLPPERELADQLGVTRTLLRHVLAELADEGLVVRRQGAGTFVSQAPATVASGLSQELSRHGLTSTVRLLSVDRAPAPAGGPLAGEVTVLRRARDVAGTTVSYETSLVPGDVDLDVAAVAHGSLYAQLARLGLAPVVAREQLTGVVADDEAAAVLGCRTGAPLLRVRRIGSAASGRIVEDVVTLLRGDRFLLATAADGQGGLASMLTYTHPDQD